MNGRRSHRTVVFTLWSAAPWESADSKISKGVRTSLRNVIGVPKWKKVESPGFLSKQYVNGI